MDEIKRVARKLEHKGKILEFYSDTMQLPDGKQAQWDFIKHKGAAAVVPVDDEGNVIMVRQYRNALERETIELPAGARNDGEDLQVTAVRELEEETGYVAEEVGLLFNLYTTVAYCDEKIGIYYARGLKKKDRHLDEDEYVDVEKYSLDELVHMIYEGKIQDSKTIAGLLAYKLKFQQV